MVAVLIVVVEVVVVKLAKPCCMLGTVLGTHCSRINSLVLAIILWSGHPYHPQIPVKETGIREHNILGFRNQDFHPFPV